MSDNDDPDYDLDTRDMPDNLKPPRDESSDLFKSPLEVVGLALVVFAAVWVVFVSVGASLSIGWYLGKRLIGAE